jgi:hypothetical protein
MTEIVLIVALALLVGSIVTTFWNKLSHIQSSLEPRALEFCKKHGLEKDYDGRCPLCWRERCQQWEASREWEAREWPEWRWKDDARALLAFAGTVYCPYHGYAPCYFTGKIAPTGFRAKLYHCTCGDDVWVRRFLRGGA